MLRVPPRRGVWLILFAVSLACSRLDRSSSLRQVLSWFSEIVESGERVFLDLKFHDIPNTVAAAGVEATRLGVSIFNVHAAGGSEMMRRTEDAVSETAEREKLPRPAIIAVTVLTSANSETLREIGLTA